MHVDPRFLKYNFSRYFDNVSRAGDLVLFTLTVIKLRIRDNAHPLLRSWNSSSDARIGSTTCCSYYMCISLHRYISLFFVIMLLLARLSFVANSPLNGSLLHYRVSTASRSRATFPTSSKNRCSSMWLEFIIVPIHDSRTRRPSLVRQEIVRCHSPIRQCARNVAPIATLQLMSRDPRHRGLSVSNGEVQTLVLQAAQCTRRIHASLQPREILHQSSDLADSSCSTRSWFSMSFHSL